MNILTGHMSLVGPRPIVKSEIARYAASYDLYTRVTPGLRSVAGLGHNNTTYRERVQFDEYYIRNWSIWMDMSILARTFQAVVHATVHIDCPTWHLTLRSGSWSSATSKYATQPGT